MKKIAIIGAGRLGTTLGKALSKKGFKITALTCRTLSSADKSKAIIGEGRAMTDNIQAAELGDIILLTVPDDKIKSIVQEINVSEITWKDKFVFHCSGIHSSKILHPIKAKGALTASVHPIQSFSKKGLNPEIFKGIYFGIEGGRESLKISRQIIQDIGGFCIEIKAEGKVLYHSACTVASNFFVVLMHTAVFLLEQLEIDSKKAHLILLPLAQGTLRNVKEFNTKAALSGPAIRGDLQTIKDHFNALKKFPPLQKTYAALTERALEMAKKDKKVPKEKIEAIQALLEDI